MQKIPSSRSDLHLFFAAYAPIKEQRFFFKIPNLVGMVKDLRQENSQQTDFDAWLLSVLGRRFRSLSGVVGLVNKGDQYRFGDLYFTLRRVGKILNFSQDDIQIVAAPYPNRILSRILFHVLQSTMHRFFSAAKHDVANWCAAKSFAKVVEGDTDFSTSLHSVIRDDALRTRIESDWNSFRDLFSSHALKEYKILFDGDCLSLRFVAPKLPDFIASGEVGADVAVIHANASDFEFELIYDVLGLQKLAYAAMIVLINAESLRQKSKSDVPFEDARKAV